MPRPGWTNIWARLSIAGRSLSMIEFSLNRSRLLMLSGLLMAVGVLVPRCGPLQEQQSLERWQRIQPQAIEQRIGLVGQIQPGTLSTLAAPFEANVLQKPAEEGQRVERGQLLLRLDTAQLQIQLREALAEQLRPAVRCRNCRAGKPVRKWPGPGGH